MHTILCISKQVNPVVDDNVNEPREDYGKCNKPDEIKKNTARSHLYFYMRQATHINGRRMVSRM